MQNETIEEEVRMLKREIARRMFFNMADENYILARWCGFNSLGTNFIWNSIHSIEKYLKACLLVNDKRAKDFGHDIENLYQGLKDIAEPLLPIKLLPPKEITFRQWREDSPNNFLKNLTRYGVSGVRYNEVGHSCELSDIIKLDALVWYLRRLFLHLDGKSYDFPTGETNRQILLRNKYFHPNMYGKLENLKNSKSDTEALKFAAFNYNYRFAPENWKHSQDHSGGYFENPVLSWTILSYFDSQDRRKNAVGKEVRDWLVESVILDKTIKDELINL